MSLYDLTFQDIIRKNQVLRPNEIGFVDADRRWTFGQFASDVEKLASGLADLGLERGDRIGVIAYNCYEFFLLYGAAAELGAVIVPINWRLSPDEIAFILQDSAPKAVIASSDFGETLPEILNQCPSVEERIAIGSPARDFRPMEEIRNSSSSYAPAELTQQDPMVMIYTAAIAGRPRGAVLSHGNAVASCLQVSMPMKLVPQDSYLNLLPLFHIMGFELAMAMLQTGGSNIILDRFDPSKAAECIESEQVSVIGAVPPMLGSILDEVDQSGRNLQSLRVVAGLFDHPDTIARCKEKSGATFWSGFGQTESSGYITLAPYDERAGSSGREGPMVRMRLVDDYDREVPPGQPGEITIRGPMTFKQYWNLEAETAYTFREGWHHTGDLGRLDESGYLWYMGRKAEKELIKPGGENVYPVEVEKAILQHDAIKEVCVFGVPDDQWGEAIKAICVLKDDCRIEPNDLMEFVGSRIARYKKPKYVSFVTALPKLEDGTLDRDKVKLIE